MVALSRSCRRVLRALAASPNGAAGRPVMYLNKCGNVGHLERRAGRTLGKLGLVVAVEWSGDPYPCCIALNEAGRAWVKEHCAQCGELATCGVLCTLHAETRCTTCGALLTDRGAHGLGCEPCAEREERAAGIVR